MDTNHRGAPSSKCCTAHHSSFSFPFTKLWRFFIRFTQLLLLQSNSSSPVFLLALSVSNPNPNLCCKLYVRYFGSHIHTSPRGDCLCCKYWAGGREDRWGEHLVSSGSLAATAGLRSCTWAAESFARPQPPSPLCPMSEGSSRGIAPMRHEESPSEIVAAPVFVPYQKPKAQNCHRIRHPSCLSLSHQFPRAHEVSPQRALDHRNAQHNHIGPPHMSTQRLFLHTKLLSMGTPNHKFIYFSSGRKTDSDDAFCAFWTGF